VARPAYRLLDHTADLAFEVEAESWPRLLEAATAALGDVILAETGDACREARPLDVQGDDREDVLVAWLGEVVALLDESDWLTRAASVERADAGRATGVLLGRPLGDAEPVDRVVKAVTYHDLRIGEGEGGRPWRVAVVLDL